MIDADVRQVLELARLAPSGENRQPWRFAVDGRSVEVVNVPDADRSLFNLSQRGSLVAHGCLLETLVLAAAALGIAADVEEFPVNAREHTVARVRLEGAGEPDPLADAILRRCTNRRPYDPSPLPDDERTALLAVDGVRLTGSREDVEAVAAAAARADELTLLNRNLHDFLFSGLAWTPAEERRRGTGLLIDTLELPPEAQARFRALSSWDAAQAATREGFVRALAAASARRFASAAALGAITVSRRTREEFLAAGRRFVRAWLTATALGLSFQPLTGICFLDAAIAAGDPHGLPGEHVRLVEGAYATVRERLCADAHAAVLYRVGRSRPPSARSSRLPLEALLVETRPG